jgi:branched-subunit amino acid ABC-type transport system permease component
MSSVLPFLVIGLVSGSVYGFAGVGLVLTYRTSGIFNFAHGTLAAVGAYAFFQLHQLSGLPTWLALVLAVLVIGPVLGLLMEWFARTLGNAPVVTRVVATLGIVVAVQQLAIIKYGAATRNFEPFLPTKTIKVFSIFVGYDQLITMAVALLGTVGLSVLLRYTRLGLAMRGVVDNTELLALTGTGPATIRRLAWVIGSVFGAVSGVLIAPSIGLDATILTLLVVKAFGAAAVGLFRSLPMTYVGGLLIGVGAAFSDRYLAIHQSLRGLPSALPFLLLFVVLVCAPRRRLVDIAPDRRRPVDRRSTLPRPVTLGLGVAGVLGLLAVPELVGSRLVVYAAALPAVLIFLSLVLLDRLSGQLSLAQLAFAGVGGAIFSHAVTGTGLPWLIAVLGGALVAVPVGLLLAIPAIRLSGLYLALATLGFGLVMEALVFSKSWMYGSAATLPAPRPSFAQGDRAYYYLLLAIVLACSGLVVGVRRARLGRLLRAMADSPTALVTNGMSTTALKVITFGLSAFLAALGGALVGPVTGQVAVGQFTALGSLLLVVVLALQGPLPDIPAAFAAAAATYVLPAYLASSSFLDYLPVLFGAAAVAVALHDARSARTSRSAPAETHIAAETRRRYGPVQARLAELDRSPA